MKHARLLLALPLLAACATPEIKGADASRYADYDCEQLDQLSESYRPDYSTVLFENTDEELFNRRVQSGASQPVGEETNLQRPYEAEQARDRRSIALARREKGC